MTKPDNRETAAAHELFCLRQLHRFGWLRSIDLAALWPGPTASARRMVQRTLKRLLAQREVLTADLPSRVPVYALAQHGAERLRGYDAECFDTARSGADLLRNLKEGGDWQHRCLCNELIIWAQRMTDGSDYPMSWYTERDVLAGRTPGGWGQAQFLSRRADGIAVLADTEVLWLEVERTSKPARSHQRLMEAIRATADYPRHEGLTLTLLVLAATEVRYLRKVRDQLSKDAQTDPRARNATVAYLLHTGHAAFQPWPEGSELPWEMTEYEALLHTHQAHEEAIREEARRRELEGDDEAAAEDDDTTPTTGATAAPEAGEQQPVPRRRWRWFQRA